MNVQTVLGRFKTNEVRIFNHRDDHAPLYVAPADKWTDDGQSVWVDVSSSMELLLGELKAALSAYKVMSNIGASLVLPKPDGATNLFGNIAKFVRSGQLGNQQLVILTDGVDNNHDITSFPVGLDATGAAVHKQVQRDMFDSFADYMNARQEAILEYLESIGAKVHIIGIGNEVTNLLRLASQRRMVAAHIPQGSNNAQVANVLQATLLAPDRARLDRSNFATAEMHAAAGEARIVTIDNLADVEPSLDVVDAAQREVARVVVGEDAMTIDEFKSIFEQAEEAANLQEAAKRYTRAVVLWLLNLAADHENEPMPGAAIGSKLSKVFQAPEGCETFWPVNQLLAKLRERGLLTAKRVDEVSFSHSGRTRNFTKVTCYACVSKAAPLLREISSDQTWTAAAESLVLSKKRAMAE
jgi:hypothetical protein